MAAMTEENDKMNSHPAPQHRLADLRDWLMDRIDGSIETRGEDGLISDFIRQIDAVSSEMGAIPAAETPITQALVSMLEAGWLSLGSSAPGAVRPLVEALEVFERENADLKQRLLPQFAGRAQRAEHERDALLEQLIAARSATAAPVAWCVGYDDPRMGRIHSDPTMHKPQAEALAKRNGLALVSLYAGLPPVREGGAPIAKESAA